mmetsp:Transcript_7355/g.10701  ORF Transcript_7355/g.10701 Transcript_7355/m.10701 type:complete len:85 (-) Transcript_7355:232-486(-)
MHFEQVRLCPIDDYWTIYYSSRIMGKEKLKQYLQNSQKRLLNEEKIDQDSIPGGNKAVDLSTKRCNCACYHILSSFTFFLTTFT